MGDAISAYTAGMVEGQGSNRNGSNSCNDAFGGGWWIWIIFLFVIFAWGGNGGWGNGNGNNGNSQCCNNGFSGGGAMIPYFSGMSTRADITDGFNFNGIQRGITGIQQGICDSTYALNNAITNGVNSTNINMLNGFNNTNTSLMQGFNGVERGFCNLSSQLADCCCKTQSAIEGVNYNLATQFCALQNSTNNNARDIIQSTHNDTDRILGALNQMESTRQQEKIQALQTENQTLKFAASQAAQNSFITANQEAQTAELIRRLGKDYPVPSYIVPNPNCCYGNPTFSNCNNNCNSNCCGCGC